MTQGQVGMGVLPLHGYAAAQRGRAAGLEPSLTRGQPFLMMWLTAKPTEEAAEEQSEHHTSQSRLL